ncbi:MAG: acyl-ACP--UDP-N-acetylglucosamine O-acyltransferase [Chromatiales bacterium]|nr:acyl-ACP--UDP-N-acetylglucosamine O-acyltransferase [Gammaproteobacteria bacterium]MCP5352831.1 acyl-ACP--UDP-N-acetylglucosamine O-acyltransferase [Chromatiales bacterium]
MIHATAIIDPDAQLADDVEVGPYSVIGAGVEIGTGSRIGPHVVIEGPTCIGRDNRIFQFASIGAEPQDKKYAGEPTTLVIGDGNTIRECVTINRGTVQDRGETTIGDDNWIMAYCHIAHDCVIGSHTIFANNATLAGHVEIHDHVILGGFTRVHQFCRVGAYAFTAMGTGIPKDVPPFVRVAGHLAEPFGLNAEGLKRKGFSTEEQKAIKDAYRVLYRSKLSLDEAIAQIGEMAVGSVAVTLFHDFLANGCQRSIVR